MKATHLSAIAACLLLASIVGCRAGGQVYEVKDAPIETAEAANA